LFVRGEHERCEAHKHKFSTLANFVRARRMTMRPSVAGAGAARSSVTLAGQTLPAAAPARGDPLRFLLTHLPLRNSAPTGGPLPPSPDLSSLLAVPLRAARTPLPQAAANRPTPEPTWGNPSRSNPNVLSLRRSPASHPSSVPLHPFLRAGALREDTDLAPTCIPIVLLVSLILS
jgi:hypothetical protein